VRRQRYGLRTYAKTREKCGAQKSKYQFLRSHELFVPMNANDCQLINTLLA
jgi:hypothetical protein